MKALVAGLGSMGQRRVRNLRALGHAGVAGFDIREDRRAQAERNGVVVFPTLEEALETFRPDVMIVSTSPAHHLACASLAVERRLPCFIEASVVDADGILALHRHAVAANVLVAPSCTMRYFEGPRKVKELLGTRAVGDPLVVTYHTGQYLPDWHPWEPISDYYVSERSTGGCREIVPFELTWLNDIFGTPEPLACIKTKLSRLDADIDDVYHCVLQYPGRVLLNMTVEVISRPRATREMRVLGTEGLLAFSGDDNSVRVSSTGNAEWQRFDLRRGTAHDGYINPEEPYIAEMREFLDAARSGGVDTFQNTLLDDCAVIRTLCRLEALSEAAL